MANTTWNPADKSANITLSGTNNLIATATSGIVANVRAIHSQTNGKIYWEVTDNSVASGNSNVGVATSTFTISTSMSVGGATGTSCLTRNGNIYVNGTVQPGISFGTITNGTVVCVALDLINQRIWFRLGAAGNWNANVANNPATNVGGVAISAGLTLYPIVGSGVINDQFTGNFGDTAFTGAVPAGFNPGFPTIPVVVGGGTTQARSMVLA